MIFVGDIAVPAPLYSSQLSEVFRTHEQIFKGQELLCNLEGLLADIDTQHKTPVLFNHPSVTGVLSDWKVKVAGLANNHTLDLPEYYDGTKKILDAVGIAAPGAGRSKQDAEKPAEVELDGKQAFVFNYCWHVMLQHQKNPSGKLYVSTIHWKRILAAVSDHKRQYPNALIIVMMHWSFDLETLPFPIYRQFSRALIDAGANVIAGCHSHCVQGAEAYKNGYIVYGMGNFFVPWHTFINGTIHFPEFARKEMAFEWDPETNKARCHWFEYNNAGEGHRLDLIASEDFTTGEILAHHSPFMGMDDTQYLHFFKANRRKKGGIPIYKDYRKTFNNRVADRMIITRIRFARMLAKYKVREWNN